MTSSDIGLFRVAVGAVILNSQNQVLLTQRSPNRDHHAGEWEITSGRLDQGEGFIEALMREVKEELKIEIEPIAPLNTFHFFRGEDKQEHVGVAYLARLKKGQVQVDGIEEVAFKWLDFDHAIDLVNDASIKANLKLARDYLSSLK